MSVTTKVFPRIGEMETALRVLTQQIEDRFTGETTTSLVLSNAPIAGSLMLFKNGALLDPGSGSVYSVSGRTVTLGVAAIAGDVFVARYYFTSFGG